LAVAREYGDPIPESDVMDQMAEILEKRM